jgi:hypothetical protein
MFVNSDFSDLLRLFNGNGVRCLVVGGYAFNQYSEPRYIGDLDFWTSTDAEALAEERASWGNTAKNAV